MDGPPRIQYSRNHIHITCLSDFYWQCNKKQQPETLPKSLWEISLNMNCLFADSSGSIRPYIGLSVRHPYIMFLWFVINFVCKAIFITLKEIFTFVRPIWRYTTHYLNNRK